MRSLLPAPKLRQDRSYIGEIIGPPLGAGVLTPEEVEEVRKLELGEISPPALVVDVNRQLVLIDIPKKVDAAKNIRAWKILKAAAFSTTRMKTITLDDVQRRANRTARIGLEVAGLTPEEEGQERPVDPEHEEEDIDWVGEAGEPMPQPEAPPLRPDWNPVIPITFGGGTFDGGANFTTTHNEDIFWGPPLRRGER